MEPGKISLEERVARLEGALGWMAHVTPLNPAMTALCLSMSLPAIYCGYFGLGVPNHHYQWTLGFLTVLLAYHRNWLRKPKNPWVFLLGFLNGVQVSILYKLFIGSGTRNPFFWVHYPGVIKRTQEGKWWELVPEWTLAWTPAPIASYTVDLTLIQTFLLVITLVGALFRFQPFVSLTALALIMTSLPAFSSFDWPFVFPAISLTAVCLYLQTWTTESEWKNPIPLQG